MRSLLLALVVTGCGGGASVSTDPEVTLQSSLCSIFSTGLISVNADFNIALDVGQGFESTIQLLGATPGQTNHSFNCDNLSLTPDGQNALGCQRDSLNQPAMAFIEQFFDTQVNPPPAQLSVQIVGSVLMAPRSDVMLANDSTTITCSIQE